MYCPAFRNAKVKVATADRSTDMLFGAKTTPPDRSSILPQGLKYVAVRLLSGETYYFVVDINNKAIQLFHQVCCMLKIGKTELFGLAVLSDGVYNYVDQDLKISKYAPKSWKTQSGNGVDIKGNILTFYFRVEIYVDCHMLINDKIARHHYYLQLKENLLTYSQPLNEERIFLLAAYALQADFGNYNPKTHTGKYFEPLKYFPSSIVSKVGEAYIIQHAPAMHEDNTGLSCGEAEISYIREASDHISPLNLHIYKMNTKKSKESPSIWLAISPVGIEIYKEDVQKMKTHISSFPWADVSKLFFDKRKFEIRSCAYPEDRKFTYYAGSEEAAKNLLRLSKENHLYYLATRKQVQAFNKIEREGRKKFRESYIYSDISELDREHTQRDSGVVPDKTTREDQLEDASHQLLKNYHTKAKNIINSRSQNVRVGAYESFMQSDSGHSSFAENRSSSASPEAITPSWQGKSEQNSSFVDEVEGNLNLSSIPYPSNQVVSPNVGNVESSVFQKSAGAKCFFSDLLSKCKNNSDEPTNSQSSESSHHQKSLRECSVVKTCDSDQQYIVNNNNVLNYSDYSKDQIIPVSHQPVSSFALCGRTRIGVSSLCHQPHKNTLGVLQRHEEKPQCVDIEYKPLFKTKQNLSSDSGVSSPSNGTLNGKSEQCSVCFSHLEGKEGLSSIYNDHEVSGTVLSSKSDDVAFPCIPPPPGYENSSEFHSKKMEKNTDDQLGSKSISSKLKTEPCNKSSANPLLNPVIDLQLLRQKSQDLGLPLISGLCNDRSLLMLPKTVPTCSRNRHLGVASNPRRFSCSSVNPLCTNEAADYLSGKTPCVRVRSHTSPEIRPTTWHVDSNFPWENKQVQKDTNKQLWRNYNDNDSRIKQSSTQEMYIVSPPPPSILTSFSNVVSSHATQQNICTTASRQMIPTKLSSAFGNSGNTRLPAK